MNTCDTHVLKKVVALHDTVKEHTTNIKYVLHGTAHVSIFFDIGDVKSISATNKDVTIETSRKVYKYTTTGTHTSVSLIGKRNYLISVVCREYENIDDVISLTNAIISDGLTVSGGIYSRLDFTGVVDALHCLTDVQKSNNQYVTIDSINTAGRELIETYFGPRRIIHLANITDKDIKNFRVLLAILPVYDEARIKLSFFVDDSINPIFGNLLDCKLYNMN